MGGSLIYQQKDMLKSHNRAIHGSSPLAQAGTKKIDHVEMVANMNKDLEFRHEGSVFTVCCSFYRPAEQDGNPNMGSILEDECHTACICATRPPGDNITMGQFTD